MGTTDFQTQQDIVEEREMWRGKGQEHDKYLAQFFVFLRHLVGGTEKMPLSKGDPWVEAAGKCHSSQRAHYIFKRCSCASLLFVGCN